LVGRRIGPYRIQKLLGRGGMGAVFLANRDDDQFRKSVAVKLLRFETGDPASLARFRNERQILATLDHPNIAALYDGGSTEDGLPYIVMEYVAGQPLDTYCNSEKLSIPARLRLFRQVCDAVQYAHQKLIVHRDLKPGNILVSHEGVPKLLDFGLAKLLLDPQLLGEAAVHTRTGVHVMTPEYAAPEQIRGEPVSTATDVYSLGAILYELLAGHRPHTLTSYGPDELRRISEADPKPPSAAANVPEVRGDLDNIVMKALQRDARRRYRSVEQFSEDILRHLENRTVSARPDTISYRLSRFMTRNKWAIAAVAAVFLSLSAGLGVSLYQASVARTRFQQLRKLAGRFIEMHDDVARLPGSTAVREKLVTSALDYLDNLARSAGKDAELLHELAVAYGKIAGAYGAPGQPNLGRTEEAMANFRKAIEIDRRAAALNAEYAVNLADLESQLAYLAMLNGRLPEARRNIDDAAAILAKLRTAKPGDTELLTLAASVAMSQGDLTEYEGHSKDGLPFYQQALDCTKEYVRIKPSAIGKARLHLISTLVAGSLSDNERYEDGLKVLHDSEPIIDELLAAEPQNPRYIRQKMASANYQGQIYFNETGKSLGKPAEAVAADRRYVALAQRLSDADPRNASARLSLAVANFQLSCPLAKIDPAASLRAAQNSVLIFDEDLARNPKDRLLRSRRARALRYLCYAWTANHQPAKARSAIEEALRVQQALLAETPSDASEKEQIELSTRVLQSLPVK
jgi:serine/threonine protein kinase